MFEKLIASVQNSLGIVQMGSSPHPFRHKRFLVHEQIECAVYDDWVTPEMIFTLPKIFTELDPLLMALFTLKALQPAKVPI